MHKYLFCLISILWSNVAATLAQSASSNPNFYQADHPYIQYIGRADTSSTSQPRFWAAGAYIQGKFSGTFCKVIINDELLWGTNHNYLELVIDGKNPIRIQTNHKTDTITIATGLANTNHTFLICKDTEAGIGYIELVGIICTKLLPPSPLPERKIEFVGNSITSGTGMDASVIPCHTGLWHDQHNAYMSYGATTARNLNAQWHLTSVSGIGLMHSCCNLEWVMGDVFDKINLRANTVKWDFSLYQPDVVTLCLGQNDGIQDSAKFCGNYIQFIKRVRGYYPNADIVCITSPMADETLTTYLKKNITEIVKKANVDGDKKVSSYFFKKRYHHGCDDHPDMAEHQKIATELTSYIKMLKNW